MQYRISTNKTSVTISWLSLTIMTSLLCFSSLFIAILLYNCSSNATVTLTSSADSVCPGDTVVFTCVTDTGRLIWTVNNSVDHVQSFHMINQIKMIVTKQIFELELINVTGIDNKMYLSTATAHNVLPDYNGTKIACVDGDQTNTAMTLYVLIAPHPSPPFNLTTTSLSSTPVTISWVAPLDTPLCVHSYTVTVISCNSSQVMVYNTTDKRSLLNITDLTSGGEYSVTVAGRDGAGQLGQESEELRIGWTVEQSYRTFALEDHMCAVFIKWQVSCGLKQYNYLITHNVSSDQSPITVNRTNVTLYGVQPGETYTVEITPCVTQNSSATMSNFTTATVSIKSPVCTVICQRATVTTTVNIINKSPVYTVNGHERVETSNIGFIASISSMIVIIFVMCGYIVVCAATKLTVSSESPETDINDHETFPTSPTHDKVHCRYRLSTHCAD